MKYLENTLIFLLFSTTIAILKLHRTKDYALINDFNSNDDKITLLGKAADYLLKSTSGSLPSGTGIYVNKPGNEPDELISIVKGVSSSSLNLSASYFNYVNPEPQPSFA